MQMADSGRKQQHVRQALQTREHVCHWPGCTKQVKPAMWGCVQHWFTLPKLLRERIWRAYQPGQEETMNVSPAYLQVADTAQAWIRDYLAKK